MDKMNTYFRYLRDRKNVRVQKDLTLTRGNPRVCIAYRIDQKENVLLYSIASVHPKDTFYKDRGRQIAAGRLLVAPNVIKGIPDSNFEITKKIVEDLVENDDVSRTVKKLAENWLDDVQE